jgi:hypothetical protein
MIVTDLDGTLFRDDKTVSKRTQDALARCREAGVKTVYATGRGRSSLHLIPGGLFDGSVLNNGASARAGDVPVYGAFVRPETARKLLAVCEGRGYGAGLSLNGEDIGKFWVEGCTPEIIAVIETLLPEDHYLVVANDGIGMVMCKGAVKSKAAAALARYWGIGQKEIAAFGDDKNDIDLLRFAGIGIAMGNALDEVKAAADTICRSNQKDGLALWLAENF